MRTPISSRKRASSTDSRFEEELGAAAAAAASSRRGKGQNPNYILHSLRYWDVNMPPPKKQMFGGILVTNPKSAMSKLLMKKRRITFELYKRSSPRPESAKHSQEKQGRIFRELFREISSDKMLHCDDIGDDDLVAFRVLKPQRKSDNEDKHGAEANWGKIFKDYMLKSTF